MENSLVKIVMAPQNVLEKLSKQHGNLKYAGDRIDEIDNGSMKKYNDDGAFDRELIRMGNGNMDNMDISWELEENVGAKKIAHRERKHSNNIQLIAPNKQLHKNMKSKLETPQQAIKLQANNEPVGVVTDDATSIIGVDDVGHLQTFDFDMKPKELNSKSGQITDQTTPSITTITPNDFNIANESTQVDELLPNDENIPTTNDPITFSTQEDVNMQTESSDMKEDTSAEIEAENILEKMETSTADASPIVRVIGQETSINKDVPLVVLTILKNRTVLIEETNSPPPSHKAENVISLANIFPSSPHVASEDVLLDEEKVDVTSDIPKSWFPLSIPTKKQIIRPSTTIKSPMVADTKQKTFFKKATLAESYSKYKNLPKLDDLTRIDFTPKLSLLEIETTNPPPQSDSKAKSKNTKRAIGDEGQFSNIVRPSPIRSKNFSDYFKNETSAERADRVNKSLQRLMHFVTVVGHVDSYLTKRFRSGFKNVARMFDSHEDTRRRRSNNLSM